MRSLRAFISRLRGRPVLRQHAYCAFCERGYAVAGPFAEGPRSVFICGQCAETCAKLIADERSRPGFGRSTTEPEIIRKRMQFSILLRERAGDEFAIHALAGPGRYASTLLKLVEHINRRPLFAIGLAVARFTNLGRRRKAIQWSGGKSCSAATRGAQWFIVVFAILSMMLLATISLEASCAPADAIAENEKPKPETKAVAPAENPDRAGKQVEIANKAAGADVSLELDKAEYFLGENIILHWRIRNTGDQPIKFNIGGDGRTPVAQRAIRFKVGAFDASGKPAADPYPNPPNMGGIGGEKMLRPGDDFWDDLQLMRYREIASPGSYTVKVYHDLGWGKRYLERAPNGRDSSDIPANPREAPIATTTVRLVMPSAEEARQIVDGMLAMRTDAGRSWGKKGNAFADFELLRYPVYLPIAKELAQHGDSRGLEMIGAMAFPEATAALVDLMKDKDANIAAKAGDLLLKRTPYIYDDPPSRRSYLVDQSWTGELKKLAMAPAWEMLASNDREALIRGAGLIQSLGDKDDLPALINVMDRVLVALKDDAIEQRIYLRPSTASEELTNASLELLRRGAHSPKSATTPGRSAVWLLNLGFDENFRPEGWAETARGLIKHEIPFIRDLALRNIPLPLDDPTVPLVAEAINDEFAPVQGAACELARKAKLRAFGPSLAEVLHKTTNEWVLRAAFDAAVECGVENDQRLEECVLRMRPRDNDWNMLILGLLIGGTIDNHGYGAQAIDDWRRILPDIQTAWLEFIIANKQALREGRRFGIAAPPLTPGMLPPGFQLYRKGQPPWSEKSELGEIDSK